MKNISKNQLEELLKLIAWELNIAISNEEALSKNKSAYVTLESAKYGVGYQLVKVNTGENKKQYLGNIKTLKEMYFYLTGIIDGIAFSKEKGVIRA